MTPRSSPPAPDTTEARADDEAFFECKRQANEYISVNGTDRLVDELRKALNDRRRVKVATTNTIVLLAHIDALEARLRDAERERDELIQEMAHPFDKSEYDSMHRRMAAAEQQATALADALRFYADEDRHEQFVTREYHSMYDNVSEPSVIEIDKGAKAREALAASSPPNAETPVSSGTAE